MAETWHISPEYWLKTPVPIRRSMFKELAMREEGRTAWTPDPALDKNSPAALRMNDFSSKF